MDSSDPTYKSDIRFASLIPPTAVGGYFRASCVGAEAASRRDLNNPPTAVGGIESFFARFFFRLDLNDPPTAVGGIRLLQQSRGNPLNDYWKKVNLTSSSTTASSDSDLRGGGILINA